MAICQFGCSEMEFNSLNHDLMYWCVCVSILFGENNIMTPKANDTKLKCKCERFGHLTKKKFFFCNKCFHFVFKLIDFFSLVFFFCEYFEAA